MKEYTINYLQELSKRQQEFLMKKDYYLNKSLDVFEYDMAYVLPTKRMKTIKPTFCGGVVDKNMEFVRNSGMYAYGTNDKLIDSYKFDINNIEYIDEEVVYMNVFFDQWGHYIMDTISRLWYVLNNSKNRIVYSCIENHNTRISNNNNFEQIIKLLGIDINRLICVDKRVVRFKKVIIPEMSIYPGKYYTNEYLQLINTIVSNSLKNSNIKCDSKIYLSRRNYKLAKEKEINEEEIENVFINNGFKVVYMESIDAADQIKMLNTAEIIVCPSGTIAHNCVFIANKKCNLVILNKTYRTNILQYQANQVSKANIIFVDSYLAPLPVSNGAGPFWYAITKEFNEFCKDNNILIKREISKLKIVNIIKYYYIWLLTYKRRLFEFKKIGKSDLKECAIQYEDLRKHYRKRIKNYIISK